jgi:galactose mutarotase-like enzyme
LVEYDSTLKPTGRLIDFKKDASEEEKEYDFSKFRKIEGTVFDKCYTNLETENGIATTTIKYNNRTVSVWQDAKAFPYTQGMFKVTKANLVVYSFDPSKKGHSRKGFAIEAESCCGFAFNVPNLGQLELNPGEEFKGSWGVTSNIL